MKLFIHIGLRRTATTFFQKEVFPNIDPGKFNFVEINSDRRISLINKICFEEELYFNHQLVREEFEPCLIDDKINLISKETLSGDPYNGGIHRSAMLRKLNKCFPEAGIILFIRRQDKYAHSNYITSIRRGSNLSLEEFYRPALKDGYAWKYRYPNPTLDCYLYHEYVKYIFQLFGKNGVLVVPFERFQENSDKVIREICSFIGVEPPLYKEKKINSSWGRRRIFVSRLVNLFFRDRQNPYGFWQGIPVYSFGKKKVLYITYSKIVSRLGIEDPLNRFDKPYIDKHGYSQELLDLCKEDNQKLDQEYDLDLGRYGYY